MPAGSTPPLKVEDLLGTWILSACEARAEDGSVSYPYGAKPQGRLILLADGAMLVMLMNPERPPFASNDQFNGSEAEVRAAFEGFLGYYGRFTLDSEAGALTFDVDQAWFPNWSHTPVVRYASLSAGQLLLRTSPYASRGVRQTFYLTWSR